jgi:hypothetical protein
MINTIAKACILVTNVPPPYRIKPAVLFPIKTVFPHPRPFPLSNDLLPDRQSTVIPEQQKKKSKTAKAGAA